MDVALAWSFRFYENLLNGIVPFSGHLSLQICKSWKIYFKTIAQVSAFSVQISYYNSPVISRRLMTHQHSVLIVVISILLWLKFFELWKIYTPHFTIASHRWDFATFIDSSVYFAHFFCSFLTCISFECSLRYSTALLFIDDEKVKGCRLYTLRDFDMMNSPSTKTFDSNFICWHKNAYCTYNNKKLRRITWSETNFWKIQVFWDKPSFSFCVYLIAGVKLESKFL